VLEANTKRADQHVVLEDLRRATKVLVRTLADLLGGLEPPFDKLSETLLEPKGLCALALQNLPEARRARADDRVLIRIVKRHPELTLQGDQFCMSPDSRLAASSDTANRTDAYSEAWGRRLLAEWTRRPTPSPRTTTACAAAVPLGDECDLVQAPAWALRGPRPFDAVSQGVPLAFYGR
jgi:hypothetical protein